MSKSRREREIEETRELILKAAGDIIADEGFEKLSFRKIAGKIEYSPAMIYSYFKDKNDIVNSLMKKNYGKIVSSLALPGAENMSPEEKLVLMSRNYINTVLEMPDGFLAAQMNSSKEALDHTSYLFQGAANEKQALMALCRCLGELYDGKQVSKEEIEMTAQMIATSTLGLVMRLTVEKEIGEEQKKRLIDFFSEEIVLRVAKGIKENI